MWAIYVQESVIFVLFMTSAFGLKLYADVQEPNSCGSILSTIESNIPVEKYYPNTEIRLDVNDRSLVPRGKSFIFWRERTPPWIPDSSFAWHYLNREAARRAGIGIITAEAKATSRDLPIPKGPLSKITYIEDFSRSYPKNDGNKLL